MPRGDCQSCLTRTTGQQSILLLPSKFQSRGTFLWLPYLPCAPQPPSAARHRTSNLFHSFALYSTDMSAAVMPNYYFPPFDQGHVADSQVRVQNWMFARMAQYPPPPQPEQQHYNAMYPTSASAQQLIDPQDQLQYSNLNQPLYPKVESATSGQASSSRQIHHLAQELQQHAAIDEQQRQVIHQASQQVQQGVPHGQPSSTPHSSQPQTQQCTPEQNQKTNRLRKACDSCSIRKVKVRSCHVTMYMSRSV